MDNNNNNLSRVPNNEISMVTEAETISKNAGVLVNSVMARFQGMYTSYGYSFKEKAIENSYKKELIRSFLELGVLRSDQIKIGLSACIKNDSEFVPRAATFAKWCLGNDLLTDVLAVKYLKQLSALYSFEQMGCGVHYKCSDLITALYGVVDWSYLKRASEKQALEHCKNMFSELMANGYRDPVTNTNVRLETREVVVGRFDEAKVAEVANRKINTPEYQKIKQALKNHNG